LSIKSFYFMPRRAGKSLLSRELLQQWLDAQRLTGPGPYHSPVGFWIDEDREGPGAELWVQAIAFKVRYDLTCGRVLGNVRGPWIFRELCVHLLDRLDLLYGAFGISFVQPRIFDRRDGCRLPSLRLPLCFDRLRSGFVEAPGDEAQHKQRYDYGIDPGFDCHFGPHKEETRIWRTSSPLPPE